MNQFIKKKSLSVFLALTLVLALSISAFAAWPSFQNDNTNNGVVTTQPPITTPSSVAEVALPYGGTTYTGVDATSVIGGNTVYTVYNGGTNGARVAATALDVAPSPTPTPTWTVELFDSGATSPADVHANNVSQLSTPYLGTLSTANDVLYALKSWTTSPLYTSSTFNATNWDTDDVTFASGTATFPANITSDITSMTAEVTFATAVHTLSIQTDLNPGTSTTSQYSITLEPEGGGTEITLVPETVFTGSYGTYYTYNGDELSGNYTITLTVDAGNTAATATNISFSGYNWALYLITVEDQDIMRIAYGEGQANTPISYDNSGNIYWGIWGGDRTYYQIPMDLSGPAVPFRPGNDGDNFYGAGAAFVSRGENDDYMVFGSDSGTVYVRPTGDFASGSGNQFEIDPANPIRSSIAVDSDAEYAYFTSYVGTSGLLWQVQVNQIFRGDPQSLTSIAFDFGATTSTPVASANGYVYVGWYNGFTSGGVVGIEARSFTQAPLFDVYGNGADSSHDAGAPVQASPIVYSTGVGTENRIDYIYFTTNSGSGEGYCYYNEIDADDIDEAWYAGGTSGNPYAVQGFASDGGYLVYGDDGNYLYIMH
jgi:hypothetical protein